MVVAAAAPSHCLKLGSVIRDWRVAVSSLPKNRHAVTWPTRPPSEHHVVTVKLSTGPDLS